MEESAAGEGTVYVFVHGWEFRIIMCVTGEVSYKGDGHLCDVK